MRPRSILCDCGALWAKESESQMLVSIKVSMPLDLASELESLARSKQIPLSTLVSETLSTVLFDKSVNLEYPPRSHRDGKDQAARAIIAAHGGMTVSALIDRLADAGIKRGKTWVTEARLAARG